MTKRRASDQAAAKTPQKRRFEQRDIESLCRLADANAEIATAIAQDMIDGVR